MLTSPFKRKKNPEKRSVSFETRFWISGLLFLVLYFIAASIGSGWMFLLASSVLAGLICGVCWPVIALNNIEVLQSCPSSGTANEPIECKISLAKQNDRKKRFFPSLFPPTMLLVRHEWPSFIPQNGSGQLDEVQPKSRRRKPLSFDALIETFDDEEVSFALQRANLPRGVHPFGNVFVRTCFPLGVAWAERSFATPGTITMYPKSFGMEGFFLFKLKSLGTGSYGFPKDGTSAQSIFTRSIRDYVRGDSPRSIHWKSTARAGQLMVREYEAEGIPHFDISFDLKANWSSTEQFELAISTIASLLTLAQRMGLGPELILNPDISELALTDLPTVLPGYELIMELLARVAPMKTQSSSPKWTQPARSEERTLVVVCPQFDSVTPSDNTFVIEIAAQNAVETGDVMTGPNRALISSSDDILKL